MAEPRFESLLEKLEQLVSELEEGDLGLRRPLVLLVLAGSYDRYLSLRVAHDVGGHG